MKKNNQLIGNAMKDLIYILGRVGVRAEIIFL